MKEIDLIEACTDLGVSVPGTEMGPLTIGEMFSKETFHRVMKIEKENVTKEKDVFQKKKNIKAINQFNATLYHTTLESMMKGYLPLTIGGDHSLAIGSALASKKCFDNLGLIWFDAHGDFNTFATTVTGNIHGVPYATITGQNGTELTSFFNGVFYDPHHCVLVGARSIDVPGEMDNLKQAGITVFSTEDIEKEGIEAIAQKALAIVTKGTEGFHLSLDLDVMDPKVAPGVSVPEKHGISQETFLRATSVWTKDAEKVKAIDLVEYNPLKDIHQQTLQIAVQTVEEIKKQITR